LAEKPPDMPKIDYPAGVIQTSADGEDSHQTVNIVQETGNESEPRGIWKKKETKVIESPHKKKKNKKHKKNLLHRS